MHRRQMLKVALASSVGGAALSRATPALARTASASANDPADLAKAVTEGVATFAKRCDDQLPLAKMLVSAIQSGDVAAAKRAYIESRPPYEEIETIANCFLDSDRDIDARPYAFEAGEQDKEFRGFHKVEALVFAYEDLGAALPYAQKLVKSIETLRTELSQRDRFSAEGQFDGMIALATEVAAKKVSSEEETWSDQTLLIFRHNWLGIMSQYRPFVRALGESERCVTQTVDAFDRAMALVEPHTKQGTAAMTPYSSIGIRERRTMADASNRLRDALVLTRGTLGI